MSGAADDDGTTFGGDEWGAVGDDDDDDDDEEAALFEGVCTRARRWSRALFNVSTLINADIQFVSTMGYIFYVCYGTSESPSRVVSSLGCPTSPRLLLRRDAR